jgi:hypothetical protein
MAKRPVRLTYGEERALAAFYAGRLPAGRLYEELALAREAALAELHPASVRAPAPARALRAA